MSRLVEQCETQGNAEEFSAKPTWCATIRRGRGVVAHTAQQVDLGT